MTEKDFVGMTQTLGFSGELHTQQLYRTARQWLTHHDYDVNESQYKESKERGKRTLFIHWIATKKIDDYLKYSIDIKLHFRGLERVKDKDTTQCDVSLAFTPCLVKDYEEVWSRKPWMKFCRDAYDKFVLRSRLAGLERGLLTDVELLMGELKALLNLTQFRKNTSRRTSP